MTAPAIRTAAGDPPHPLCLGGNVFGWTADERASFEVLDRYAGAGGNFLDTADQYSEWVAGHRGGESEAIIGRWRAARRADAADLIIATKVGRHVAAGHDDLRPETIARACDESLRRLGVDCIDLYYAHADDPDVPLEESLGAFTALVQEGKIRYFGVSNFGADRLRELLGVVDRGGFAPVAAIQPHYNLLDREGFEAELAPLCAEHGISCCPYYGLAMGFLSGKYARGDSPRGARAEDAMATYGGSERAWEVVEAVRRIAAARSVPPAAVALAWLSSREVVLAPIASATAPWQVDELVGIGELDLSDDELAELDVVSAP